MDLAKARALRKNLQAQLQKEYYAQDNFLKRFEYLYNMLIKSQQYYLNWKGNKRFDSNYLDELLNNIKMNISSEDKFLDFVNEKIIKLMDSGHVNFVPHQITKDEQLFDKEISNKELSKNSNISVKFNKNTVIVAIKTFTQSNNYDRNVFDNLEAVLAQNSYDNIIIDIRGNRRWNGCIFPKFFHIYASYDCV